MGYKVRCVCVVLLICSTLTIIAVGCEDGSKSSNRSNTIEYVSMWNNYEPQAEYLRQLAISFEKETAIPVKLEFAGRDVLTKVRSRLLMGDSPDLLDQDFNELAVAMSRGSLQVTDFAEMFNYSKGPEGQKRFIDIFGNNFTKLYEKDNGYFFFPYEFITSGFFYDKSLYKQYGLQAPKTWEEFLKNNEVFNSHNIKPLALDGKINWYNAYYFCWAVERIFGPGGFRAAVEDKSGALWNEPGYLKAAEMIYELSKAKKNYFQEEYAKSEWPTAQIEWAQGKYGSILCSTWIPQETKKYTKPEFDYGFFPFPEVDGGKGKVSDVEIGYIGCVIPKGSKNVSKAKEFLAFMMRKENAQKFSDLTSSLSARADVNYPQLLSCVRDYTKKIGTPYKSIDGVWAYYPDFWAKFLILDDQLIFGNITPSAFIKAIQKETIEFWAQKKSKK